MVWFSRKTRAVVPTIASRALAEAIKTAVSAVAAATLTGPAVALLIGTVSKDLVDILLARASAVEKKLDRLLREPLLTGLRLLAQALSQSPRSDEERAAVNGLLQHAHVSLTRALALCGDLREDSLLVRGIDCIALAAHPGHQQLARSVLNVMRSDLQSERARVSALQKTAADAMTNARDFEWFLNGEDPWRDKPYGYGEQRGLAKQMRSTAEALSTKADEAHTRCEILEGLAALAERRLEATPVAL